MPIVAALDPSISNTGFAVLQDDELQLFGQMPLRTSADVAHLVAVLAEQTPDVVAIENTFISVNAKTGIDLAELRGRLRQELDRRSIPTQLVQPSQWRKTTIKPPPKAKRKDLKALSKAYALQRFGVTVLDDAADAICIAAHVATVT